MDYVAQKNTASYDYTPCQWSADDCYPARLLSWLRQQTESHHTAANAANIEFEGA